MHKIDISCDDGMNQQNSGGYNYANQISSENRNQNVFTLHRTLAEYRFFPESNPVSKMNAVCKMKNGDLPSKPKMNTVFNSKTPKRTPRIKEKRKDRFYERGEGAIIRKLKAVLENFWTSAHQKLYGNLN
ncbi:hypothetical protein ACTXT7_014544 [Hymenolepis weldensis]